jgi:hypothetical protein
VRAQGFFEPHTVTALLDRHTAGKEDLSRQVWGLLMFSLWHDRYVKQAAAPELRTAS